MSWFNNLKTGTKLVLGLGLMVVLLAVMWVTAQRAMAAIVQSRAVAVEATSLEASLNADRAVVLTLISAGDAAMRDSLFDEAAANGREATANLADMRAIAQSEPDLRNLIDQFAEQYRAYAQVRDGQTLALLRKGQVDAARGVSLGEQNRRYLALRPLAHSLSDQALAIGTGQAKNARTTFVVVGVLAVIVALLTGWLLTRAISDPLRSLTAAAERIAVGDLPPEETVLVRGDEVGALHQAFARMGRTLRQMATVAGSIAEGDLRVRVEPQSERDVLGKAFALMVENLRGLTRELHEGISVLSTSATEISTSTSELAASATQTAAAISETTTTVEEVRQTAQMSSEKARAVSDSALRVASVSEEGRKATDDAAAGIARIQQQMELIAESMVRLSEQSQAVGQIVATVEDLSGQSKLLAVNASIEAAKAGEHGKGFAVVAQEVKSLAEQSRQATAQVRSILGDIQQATSAAVLATEQGSHAVAEGVRQSTQAGHSIQALAGSVGEASQAAVQIAASSQQQLVGVDQVATAMESIKLASAQNVDSAKQMESAAHGLKLLGEKLRQIAVGYRV
ncbi:methyl-accepting chemotaxis protein [Frateuria terrea]|uniref:Methyl-accepting chemotaxis sensory transducer n=1 Tax=Frateuria terrea TaxID=529704 RepID=A0A1H6UB85_9GAMM|nr:methyl-accepting chemotaxis protein [Frateuria terrea]SEI88836.1 methyl-accepting chemotaxis sensory transducer [Frateuria terrea]SFP37502.1 Methyl-accepting chemotaxis protein [Frateuria terrea]